MVVRVINNETLALTADLLRSSIVARSNDRQATGQCLKHYQRARIVKSRMHQKIGPEECIARIGPESKKDTSVGHTDGARQPLVAARVRMTDYDEAERFTPRKIAERLDQWA